MWYIYWKIIIRDVSCNCTYDKKKTSNKRKNGRYQRDVIPFMLLERLWIKITIYLWIKLNFITSFFDC